MLCGQLMVKNGKTRAGTTRWRCMTCGMSRVQCRDDIRYRKDTQLFVSWLFSHMPVEFLPVSRSTLSRHIQWCWHVPVPSIPTTGVIEPQILIDGIYLPYKWCLLIAMNTHHVLAWQWCHRENTAAYKALLEQLVEPECVCLDGGPGAHRALHETWPDVRIQRCLVHVARNIRVYLTSKPRTIAGKSLLTLSKKLLRIHTQEQAIQWQQDINQWYQTYGYVIHEVTANPRYPYESPAWWYTHARLRKAYRLLERLIRKQHLFTYLNTHQENHQHLLNSTNRLEGGVNKTIRRLLSLHPGLSQDHMRCAIEWTLTSMSENPVDIITYLSTHHDEAITNTLVKPTTNEKPDTTINDHASTYDPQELQIHYGWAGRTT
nr:IS1249 family transposase [Alloscardovia theropitheci]